MRDVCPFDVLGDLACFEVAALWPSIASLSDAPGTVVVLIVVFCVPLAIRCTDPYDEDLFGVRGGCAVRLFLINYTFQWLALVQGDTLGRFALLSDRNLCAFSMLLSLRSCSDCQHEVDPYRRNTRAGFAIGFQLPSQTDWKMICLKNDLPATRNRRVVASGPPASAWTCDAIDCQASRWEG